jgi:hypothetical protein
MMSDELRTINIDDIPNIVGLEDMIVYLVEWWYSDKPLDTHDYLDRIDNWLFPLGYGLPSQLDDPTIKFIMRRARQTKKECNQ